MRSLSRSSASPGGACRRSPTSLSRSSSCCCISSAFGAPSSAISPAESGARAPGSSAPARDLQLLGFPPRGASVPGRWEGSRRRRSPPGAPPAEERGFSAVERAVADDEGDSAAVFPSHPRAPLSPPSLPRDATRFRCEGAWLAGWCVSCGGSFWVLALWSGWGLGCVRESFGRIGGRFMGEEERERAGGRGAAGGLDCALPRGLPKLHTPQAPTDGRVGWPWNPLHLAGLASARGRGPAAAWLDTARRAPPHPARSRPSLAWGGRPMAATALARSPRQKRQFGALVFGCERAPRPSPGRSRAVSVRWEREG